MPATGHLGYICLSFPLCPPAFALMCLSTDFFRYFAQRLVLFFWDWKMWPQFFYSIMWMAQGQGLVVHKVCLSWSDRQGVDGVSLHGQRHWRWQESCLAIWCLFPPSIPRPWFLFTSLPGEECWERGEKPHCLPSIHSSVRQLLLWDGT